MLAGIFEPERIVLPAPGTWQPVPPITDRTFWDGVEDDVRAGVLAEVSRFSGSDWPPLTANVWRDYGRTGNRVHYQDPYFARRDRLAAAVLAYCLTDDPRWYDEALDGIWLLLEETSWCIPPHDRHGGIGELPDPASPTLDLFAAETGAQLAWTHAVLADRLEPNVAERIAAEVTARILVPYRTVDDWVWFGKTRPHVNNWNPWINSNVLACSLLLDRSTADIELTVQRAIFGLDVFLRGYPDDGGCDEGASYWWRAGASLFECLEILRSVTGLDAFGLPILGEIARYLPRVHVAGDWYVNVADGAARLDRLNANAHLVWQFGRRVGDPTVEAHGRALRGSAPAIPVGARLGRGLGRSLLALADTDWRAAADLPDPLLLQTYLPDTELFVARSRAGTADGLLLSVKGGHNGEDHNHNDVGTVLVAVDGQPALVDAGVAEYTAAHFGPERYSIWTMRSSYHNVPSVDGVEQGAGPEFAARDLSAELTDSYAEMSLDLAAAYPAGITSWRRTGRLDRSPDRIVLRDEWELDHEPSTVELHFLASSEPTITTDGFSVGRLDVAVDAGIAVERIDLEDRRLRWAWGDSLWRITVSAPPSRTGSLTFTMTVPD